MKTDRFPTMIFIRTWVVAGPAGVLLIAVALLQTSAPLLADDVSNARAMICTPVLVTRCTPDGECVSLPPWELNIPQFIEVDLENKMLRTTRSSGQDRSSPIEHLEREGELIFLQGVENGRAFSFVIAADTGMASIAVARDGLVVTVFGACTPAPASAGASAGEEDN
ncbi:MAG: hypothetical protein QNK37_03135 [Acidobacteriota bacterium]|nr:hypothetical protein [Acidobacteriota bacterium]